MNVIYKYEVPIEDTFKVALPHDAEVLTVQFDEKTGRPVMWAKLNTEDELVEREFAVIGTGNPIPDIHESLCYNYIGTFQMGNGRFIGHLFEIDY